MSDSLPKQEKLVPISEAAKVLGVSIDTIRRWDKSGILHSERPDGKNRYFSLSELEKHKSHQPLPISEVAKKLNISTTTLRRLEARGLIKPKRNNAGERIYDQDLLENFLNSDYIQRKKQTTEKILETPPLETPTKVSHKQNLESYLKPLQRMPELVMSFVIFLLLLAIGITNINLPNSKLLPTNIVLAATEKIVVDDVKTEEVNIEKEGPKILSLLHAIGIGNTTASIAKNPNPSSAPAVLAATKEIVTAPDEAVSTSSAEAPKPKIILTIKADDGSSSVNIRQKPAVTSEKIGEAKIGDTFEFVSLNLGWYEVKLTDRSIGFISAKYIKKEENN